VNRGERGGWKPGDTKVLLRDKRGAQKPGNSATRMATATSTSNGAGLDGLAAGKMWGNGGEEMAGEVQKGVPVKKNPDTGCPGGGSLRVATPTRPLQSANKKGVMSRDRDCIEGKQFKKSQKKAHTPS